jgi:anthranilate phosphoribosyltransferase
LIGPLAKDNKKQAILKSMKYTFGVTLENEKNHHTKAMNMKDTLNYLFTGKTLSRETAKATLTLIGKGGCNEAEIAAFLTVFNIRKIKAEEMAGFRDAMFDLCLKIDLSEYNTIDVCGTGGDGKNTFNISTLSAFVLAGAGIKVTKHGNYGLSSPCGSSNIFEHFGYKLSNDAQKLKTELEETNICYFHAPLFHPAMKYVMPVRKALKVKTFFNMLGPLMNPSNPKNQLAGVFNMETIELYHEVFNQTGTNHMAIFDLAGYDEISLTGDFRYLTNGTDRTISPASLGFEKVQAEKLHGGNTIDEAAEIFLNILENKGTKAQKDVVVANAAFAIHCFYPEKDIEACIEMAKDSLISGKARNVLQKLMEMNNITSP